MWEWASVRPCWWSWSWSLAWLMGQDLLLLPSSAVITSAIFRIEYIWNNAITLHMLLYFIPTRTHLSLRRRVARGSRQKVAAGDSLEQLTAAARHAPSFLSPADNWESQPAQQQRQPSMWGARMTSTFTHNLDLTLKCLYLMSEPWCFDLIDTISNLDALWTTLFHFCWIVSQNCFHFRVL